MATDPLHNTLICVGIMTERTVEKHHQFHSVIICVGIMTERTVEMHHQFQSVIICVGIMTERTVEMHHQFHSVPALIVILRKFHSQILRIYQHLVKYTMYIMNIKMSLKVYLINMLQ
jgi:hypothetical protein